MTLPIHLVFIINEHSRNGKTFSKKLPDIMKSYSLTYEVIKTSKDDSFKKSSTTLLNSLNDSSRLIVAGGDGTLNEVITVLESMNLNTTLGYVPTGSGNDFARSHQLSFDYRQAIEQIVHQEEATILDTLVISQDDLILNAINSFGIGLDGMVNYSLENSKNKKRLGNFSYFVTIISAYFSQKSFEVTIKQNNQIMHFPEVLLIVCVNHKYFGGGIPIHPQAVPTDELVNFVIAEKVSFFELITLLLRVLINQSHLSHKKLHSFNGPACTITLDSHQYGQTDGEWIKVHGNYKVQTKKRAFWI